MKTSADIRQTFLDFFKSKGHVIVPSAPIVIKNDPTLLFTNAGMNQFKDYFLGNKKAPYPRVADTQKCLRVSGKHNDLEEVGVDTYHHTMFEMLGNWSFGDYFKKEAIAWSWELLTERYKLDKNRLYVTIFEGDTKENLPKDEEAYNEWKKWVSEDRILPGNKKDNFWEMGDTGPCGPCSEIHYDGRSEEERKKVNGASLVNKDNPQVIEIWNNVFMEFNRLKDGSLQPLPAKHVDTGMGFERLVRVIQGKQSNYDTDVFTGTIAEVEKITNKTYDAASSPSTGESWREAVAFRVQADHVRAIAFAIADGQLPGNTGAGYVIRRILRRAVRYYYSYLDYKQPLLFQLLPLLATQFEHVFPELQKQVEFVSKVVREEEDAFLRTLEKGLKKIDEIVAESKATGIVHGKEAFELFDTYGFPVDLTRLIASENNLTVDEAGFNNEMQQQKNRSRAATAVDTEDWVILDEDGANEFVGYDTLEIKSKITRYRKVKAKGKESYQLVLNVTPFYAESGGQVGDTGELIINNEQLVINNTRKENNLIIHFADTLPGDLGGEIIAKVDVDKRMQTAAHHTATHLLHAALRTVLGTHVAQKGSLVNEEHLRFDFSHFAKVNDEEITKIEALVNEKIRENIPVVIKEMPKDEAVALGAMALFGEKYGDIVRVVIIDPKYSIELCGGTHVGATGELGFFKIKHEAAVAAGVRRIEAVSGKAAEELVHGQFALVGSIKELLKNPKDALKATENLVQENAELKKKIESLEARQLSDLSEKLLMQAVHVNGIDFIGSVVPAGSADALKKLCFDLKARLPFTVAGIGYFVVLAANIEGKASVAVMVDDTLVAKGLEAPKIIKEYITPIIKGGGGGQKTLATAGGQDTSNLQLVIDKVKALL
ncbi:MAG TPA: alanine--tRNA ligase [Chitinophagaceae bacterium]|nr:alanine--tRNA ligase [Chitinophagaceae bacterium]